MRTDFAAACAALFLLSCGGGSARPATVENATFASSLNVDLTKSTRLADGSYYRDLVVGTGPGLAAGQLGAFYFEGFLTSGAQFTAWEPLFGPPTPLKLAAGSVIPGWASAVPGLKVGGRRQILLPASAGYGDAGTPDGAVPPNSVLVFVIDLPPAVENVSFDPSLNVDLNQFTRFADGSYVRDQASGSGSLVQAGQTVSLYYTGTLSSGGAPFTSWSSSNGPPKQFNLTQGASGVLQGFIDAIPGMRVGGTRQLLLPPLLAYGATGNSTLGVPPNAVVSFTVTVVSSP